MARWLLPYLTTAEREQTVLEVREVVVDINQSLIYVGDGNTVGGIIQGGQPGASFKFYIVSTIAERDLLVPNKGEACRVTSTNVTYIYDDIEWLVLSNFNVHTVGSVVERDLLTPIIGDICIITTTSETFVYTTVWTLIASNDIAEHIDDSSTSLTKLWSSQKTDTEIKNHTVDGGSF